MSLSTEDQRENLTLLIRQAEIGKHQAECMGKAWNAVGNAQKAEACANDVKNAMLVINNLTEQLEALK